MNFSHGGAKEACRDPAACAFWIEAQGEINERTDSEFSEFLRSAPRLPYSTIRLNSPGGDLRAAVRFGYLLRSLGFTTESEFCASACLYAFLGGVERRVLGGNAKIGIHRFYRRSSVLLPAVKQFTGEDLDSTQRLMAGLLLYLDAMGSDLRLLALSLEAGATEMRWLTPIELVDMRVTYDPSLWTAWRLEVPTNSKGLVAVSERQDKLSSMQMLCSTSGLYLTLIDEAATPEWFEQCKSAKQVHRVLGLSVRASDMKVTKEPAGISMRLSSKQFSSTAVSLFSEAERYPVSCQSTRYAGSTEGFEQLAALIRANCIE